jgi:hypothetical protein
MRFTRLRRQIESGTLVGTHGQPFACSSSSSSSTNATPFKRKRSFNPEIDGYEDERCDDDSEKGMRISKWDTKVKKEWDGDEGLNSTSGEDSEDDMPLAKVRAVKIGGQREIEALPKHLSISTNHGLPLIGIGTPPTLRNCGRLSAYHEVEGLPIENMQKMRSLVNMPGLQTWSPRRLPYEDMQSVPGEYGFDSIFSGEQRYSPLRATLNDGREWGQNQSHDPELERVRYFAAPYKSI